MSSGDLTDRAFRAYFRSGGIDQPANYSGPVTEGDRPYVVLRNCNGILAVYGLRKTGVLKRLREWPEALEVW
jgi:hypothetical protein